MSPRLSDKLVMVPPFGVLERALKHLEMNYLKGFIGRALKFMVNVILIMSCSSFTAFAVRTAAAQVNNTDSHMKISYEAVHYINILHSTSSNLSYYANFVSYKLSSSQVGATWCTTTHCASALPRALRLPMALSTAQTTFLHPISTLTSPIQPPVRVVHYISKHACVYAYAGMLLCLRSTIATRGGVPHQPESGASSPPSKLPESPIITSPIPPTVENEASVVSVSSIPPLPLLPSPPPHTPPAGPFFVVLFRGVRVCLLARARARHLLHPQLHPVENRCRSSENSVCVCSSSSGCYRCYLTHSAVCM